MEGNIKRIGQERILTDDETKQIKDLHLSPRQEEAVRSAWAKEDYKRTSITSTVIGLLIPLLIDIALAANIIYSSRITAGFSNLAVILVWILGIFATLIGIGFMFTPSDKNPVFGHVAMELVKKAPKLKSVYSPIVFVVMISLMAFNGYLITTFVLFLIALFVRGSFSAAKDRVKKALAAIDAANY